MKLTLALPVTYALLLLSAGACTESDAPGQSEVHNTQTQAVTEEIMGRVDPADLSGRVEKTDSAWKAQLSELQYRVTRTGGTEPAFTGEYVDFDGHGLYECVCCGKDLFRSGAKFHSGTGWPSFYEPVAETAVREITDTTLGMTRTEVRCARCGAHLGHVFDDGPRPTGLRYCINSVSLNFVPTDEAKD